MQQNRIGEYIAMFWIAYSIVLENKQNYVEAENILEMGLARYKYF